MLRRMNSQAGSSHFTLNQKLILAGWWIFAMLAAAFFLIETTLTYNDLTNPSQHLLQNLAALGWSVHSHAFFLTALRLLFGLTHFVIAGLIIYKRPNENIAVFVAFFLVLLGSIFWPPANQVASQPEFWKTPRYIAQFLNGIAFLVFFFIFPDGKFTPRWTRTFTILVIPFIVGVYFLPQTILNPRTWDALPLFIFSITVITVMIHAPIHRYRNIASPTLRQQTKWIVFGISTAVLGYFLVALPAAFGFISLEVGTVYGLFAVTGMMLFFLLIPLSIGVAILRFRLWDIDPIINRTLVYGALSSLTILFYVLTVGFFASYFRNSQTNIIISFIATGIIAILFEPLRQQLQRGVNRLMYGERDDPATVLTRLSQQINSALAPDSILQTIVETLSQTLKLPYAAISLLDKEPRFTSTPNLPPSELLHLPLTYQTEHVGELTLAPRAAGESFSPADMKLIHLIAQQAGVAAYTLRLNNDLQRSRERLVTAQEEERRRLRRDLHDGVGPTLASLSQRIDTASELVDSDPEKSKQLLKDLKGQVKESVAEIRRLVYALRPPVLDEFGLVSAIREHTAQYSGPNGMQITFDVTEPLPALPAAVEVAAYRIILEAFTNLVRHAKATTCQIQIKIEDRSLLLTVADNGKGLHKGNRAGVGFASMRERAQELGGECVIENNPTGGVTVHARLPLIHQT
ncbi:MAG: hypothetical protein OHK003_26150 [Anaerolineales bacterium]